MIPLYDENPTETTPFVTIALIVINIVVYFVVQPALGAGIRLSLHIPGHWVIVTGREAAAWMWGAIPYEIFHGRELTPHYWVPMPLTLLTCMFLHGGIFHLGGNMLYLWIFGNNVEDVLGHLRFLLFYLLCGVLATLAHAVTVPNSMLPLIGASGAISGVLGAYMLRFPTARIKTLIILIIFITTVDIPAFFFIGLWFFMQFINGTASLGMGQTGGVAWFAHIGGFLAGILLFSLFPKRVPSRPRVVVDDTFEDWGE